MRKQCNFENEQKKGDLVVEYILTEKLFFKKKLISFAFGLLL